MEERSNIPLPVVVVGLILIVGLAFFIASRFMPQDQTTVVKPSAQAQQIQVWMEGKAKEVQGDFSKLSPEDQQKANEMTHGFGAMGISQSWKKISGKP